MELEAELYMYDREKLFEIVIRALTRAFEYSFEEWYPEDESISGLTSFYADINPGHGHIAFQACTGNERRLSYDFEEKKLRISYSGSRYGLFGLTSDIFGVWFQPELFTCDLVNPEDCVYHELCWKKIEFPVDNEKAKEVFSLIKDGRVGIGIAIDKKLFVARITYYKTSAGKFYLLPTELVVYPVAGSRKAIGAIPISVLWDHGICVDKQVFLTELSDEIKRFVRLF